jgi:hypothetical protein
VVKALRSHKNQFCDRGQPNDPGLGCTTIACVPNMRPMAGKSSIRCPCISRELWQSGGFTSYPGQESNPRSELTFVRTQRLNHFAIKAICALRTATGFSTQRVNHYAIKAICALRTATESSCCPQSANCFYSKVVNALSSHIYKP